MVLFFCTFLLVFYTETAVASCATPANSIEAENCLPGTPQSTWDISGTGDSSIQGFGDNISVNVGQTINFKINTTATLFHLDIYRMGYYQGNGARKVTTVTGTPLNQPNCRTDSGTGLYDCGNWGVSASWTVPSNAVSGIYFARVIRDDTGGASHIVFIVRNDASHSDILFQASDTSWQAYNDYGGKNLYGCGGWDLTCRAYKVSYNRPFHTRDFQGESVTWVFGNEYPMVRWLEANGYDVTYFTDTDTDRYGALLTNHKLWMSNGHDEYWSGGQRANVEAARNAGVHLAFFSGNTMFWKTRWENSIDGTNTPYRTLVCYKETANDVTDPLDPPTWTGTWRDPRFSPPADGGRPENAVKGNLFRMNGGQSATMQVPAADGKMRFWRNTTVATLSSGSASLAPGTVGAEFDDDEDNGFRPAGLFELSATSVTDSSNYLLDYGVTYGAGTAINKVVMYRHTSGAIVFSTGTYRWSWGLDSHHDDSNEGSTTNLSMQQATVNLFADMGIQPVSLQSSLLLATASTDTIPPASTITSPSQNAVIASGAQVTIQGTATDTGGGVVAGVEVSTDNGATWHLASGRASWSYTWIPSASGSVTIKSRAVDDSGNLETPSAGVTVSVSGGSGSSCTSGCTSIWPSSPTPGVVDQGPDSALELGVKFRSDVAGTITGIRFYKASANTGTHVGNLWDNNSNLLAQATFTGETGSGWQQVNFTPPVAIQANTVYVASYHTTGGHYSEDDNYFAANGVDSPPLHALANGVSSGNGVYAYGSTSAFPNQTYNSANYWVDVVFNPGGTAPTLKSIAVTPANPTILTGTTQQFTATGTYSDSSTQNLTSQVTWASSNTAVATINSAGLATDVGAGSTTISATVAGGGEQGNITGSTTLTVQAAPLAITTTALPNGTVNVAYPATTLTASGGTTPYTWSITSGSLPPGLSLNTGTGAIAGTPTAAGTYSFTAQVSDSSNPVQTVTKQFSITITSALPTVMTIWPSTAVPTVAADSDTSAVELGVKFKADVNGQITGIRFYKSTTNTGTHTGTLWICNPGCTNGMKKATATFTGESPSGWQQVNFTTPVNITANTVYVASYHTSRGHYADDTGYFATTGVDNQVLHALQNGVSGPNGVYQYGSTSGFPTNTYQADNYWVDVVFKPSP
jgi:hypothetical protein